MNLTPGLERPYEIDSIYIFCSVGLISHLVRENDTLGIARRARRVHDVGPVVGLRASAGLCPHRRRNSHGSESCNRGSISHQVLKECDDQTLQIDRSALGARRDLSQDPTSRAAEGIMHCARCVGGWCKRASAPAGINPYLSPQEESCTM